MRLKNRVKRLEKVIKPKPPEEMKEMVTFHVYPDGTKELFSRTPFHGKEDLIMNIEFVSCDAKNERRKSEEKIETA